MATSREVYSEDDNFIIGDDFITDRFRREARQLHLSEFSRTRREAHFARYRNSFLKCDLDQTNDRIEQGRKLRLAEMERARAAVLKQQENRRKIRRESRDVIEKMIRTSSGGNAKQSPGLEEGKPGSSLSSSSSSSSRTSSATSKCDSTERRELTNPAISRLHGSSAMSFGDEDKGIVNGSNVHVENQERKTANSLNDESVDSKTNRGGTKATDHGQQTKRLSVGSSRASEVAGKQNKRLSLPASSSLRASAVAGQRDLAGKQDKRHSITVSSPSLGSNVVGKGDLAGKHEKTGFNIPSSSSLRASAVVGKRDLSAKKGKRPSLPSSSSGKSEVLGQNDLAQKQDKRLSVPAKSAPRASPTLAGEHDLAGKHEQKIARTPSLYVTSPMGDDRRSSFGSNLVVPVEQVGERDNSNEAKAKSSRDSVSSLTTSCAEKAMEPDLDNSVEGAKESKKRAHSASVYETGSKAATFRTSSSRISRVSRKRVSPVLTESDAKKAQTQSAHEQKIWKEFDKIMQGFADFLHIEHKSVNMKSKGEAVVEKDTKPVKPSQNLTSLNSRNHPMTPLYFRYGISDRIVFRF